MDKDQAAREYVDALDAYRANYGTPARERLDAAIVAYLMALQPAEESKPAPAA